VKPRIAAQKLSGVNLGVTVAALGWLLVLSIQPLYLTWMEVQHPRATLDLPRVSGIKASPAGVQAMTDLMAYVDANVPPGQDIYIGLNRHDIIIIGHGGLYFVLGRPSATRYEELHPAIADTAPVQREIIGDLKSKNVSFIILEQIFSDETLDPIKEQFQEHVPAIGATELDQFIRHNYQQTARFGPYEVWQRIAAGGT
jgi:hypothetical protein